MSNLWDKELPLTTFSSEFVEGVPFTSNLSIYHGYVYGGPTLKTSDNFKELHKWDYSYNRSTGILQIWREDLPDEKHVVFDDIKDIYELSVCFNKSMNFCVAYEVFEGSFLRLYDPLVSQYVSEKIEGATTPKVALSSVHNQHAAASQLVVGYIKKETNELVIKLEGDRFRIEYVVHKFPKSAKLINMSYADNNRFQYEVLEAL